RRGDVLEQVRERTHMVLMPVREHDAVDAIRVRAQIREVREDEVDAGHVGVREHQPTVDDDDPPLDLEAEAVPTDLPDAAQEDDPDGVSHARSIAATQPLRRGPWR